MWLTNAGVAVTFGRYGKKREEQGKSFWSSGSKTNRAKENAKDKLRDALIGDHRNSLK